MSKPERFATSSQDRNPAAGPLDPRFPPRGELARVSIGPVTLRLHEQHATQATGGQIQLFVAMSLPDCHHVELAPALAFCDAAVALERIVRRELARLES